MNKIKDKTEQLKDFLISEIRNKAYKAHDKLPSESYLQKIFDISRVTVRKALHELALNGYIYTIKGSGTYVNENIMKLMQPVCEKDSTRKIGIILPHEIDFFNSLYLYLQTECTSRGFLYKQFFNTSIQAEKEAFYCLVREKFDAVILSPNREYFDSNYKNFEILYRNNLPFVLIGKPPRNIYCNSVYYDDIAGGISLVREFYYRKCKNVIHITSFYGDSEAVLERKDGYLYGMKKFYPGCKPLIFNINTPQFKKDFSDYISSFQEKLGIILYDNAEYTTIRSIINNLKSETAITLVGFNAPPQNLKEKNVSSIEHNIQLLAKKSVELVTSYFINRASINDIKHIILRPNIYINDK